VKAMRAIFTVHIPGDVGFTDQLMQLSLLYQLGRSSGLDFRLTPLDSDRSPPGFWRLFDLSTVFPSLDEEESGYASIDIDLSVLYQHEGQIKRLADLIEVVRSQVSDEERIVHVFRLPGDRTKLARLVRERRDQADLFAAALQKVFEAEGDVPEGHDLEVLAHIRCGDSADISVPGDVSYLAWHRAVSLSGALRTNPFLAARIIFDDLKRRVSPKQVFLNLFSDGYQRTRDLVSEFSRASPTLGEEESKYLETAINVHEQIAQTINAGDCVEVQIGESLQSLAELIHHALRADVIMITSNQRMLCKFLAALGERSKKPVLLLMENTAQHVNFVRVSGISERQATMVSLSHHGDPLAPLSAYLRTPELAGSEEQPWSILRARGKGVFCLPEVKAVCEDLELQGDWENAGKLYRWMSVLSDYDPDALLGELRCQREITGGVGLERIEAEYEAALEREKARLAHAAWNLVCIGRYQQATDFITQAEDKHGSWPGIQKAKNLLKIQKM
jgi:hypothetical protein